MKKIIVTGGQGFIGSNLVEFLLEKNYFVINIDKSSYSANPYNVKDFKKNKKYIFYKLDINNKTKLLILIVSTYFTYRIFYILIICWRIPSYYKKIAHNKDAGYQKISLKIFHYSFFSGTGSNPLFPHGWHFAILFIPSLIPE